MRSGMMRYRRRNILTMECGNQSWQVRQGARIRRRATWDDRLPTRPVPGAVRCSELAPIGRHTLQGDPIPPRRLSDEHATARTMPCQRCPKCRLQTMRVTRHDLAANRFLEPRGVTWGLGRKRRNEPLRGVPTWLSNTMQRSRIFAVREPIVRFEPREQNGHWRGRGMWANSSPFFQLGSSGALATRQPASKRSCASSTAPRKSQLGSNSSEGWW